MDTNAYEIEKNILYLNNSLEIEIIKINKYLYNSKIN